MSLNLFVCWRHSTYKLIWLTQIFVIRPKVSSISRQRRRCPYSTLSSSFNQFAQLSTRFIRNICGERRNAMRWVWISRVCLISHSSTLVVSNNVWLNYENTAQKRLICYFSYVQELIQWPRYRVFLRMHNRFYVYVCAYKNDCFKLEMYKFVIPMRFQMQIKQFH